MSTFLLPPVDRSIAFISLSGRSSCLESVENSSGSHYPRDAGTRLEKGEVIWKWKSRNIINIFGASVFRFSSDGTMTRSHRIFRFIEGNFYYPRIDLADVYRLFRIISNISISQTPITKFFFVTRPHFDSRQLFSSSSNKFTRFVNNVHIFPPPRSNSILRDPIIAVTRTFFRRKINFSHPLEDATCDPSKLFPPTDNAFIVSEEHRGWKNRSKTRKTGFFGVTRADDARGSSNGKKALFFFCSLSIFSLLISLGIFQLV